MSREGSLASRSLIELSSTKRHSPSGERLLFRSHLRRQARAIATPFRSPRGCPGDTASP